MADEVVRYEVDGAIARVTMNRPEYGNAQNSAMTYALDDAFYRAAADDDVTVVVLAGAGKHFSAGHDIGTPGRDIDTSFDRRAGLWWDHVGKLGGESRYAREQEVYLGMCRRWRELPKPVIAQVHGYALGMGSLLMTMCDLVVIAEDARVGNARITMGAGMIGTKYAWAIGLRRAKWLDLLPGWRITGKEAVDWGWANIAVPAEDLDDEVAALAEQLAKVPLTHLMFRKVSLNRVWDEMGFRNSLAAGIDFDPLAHKSTEGLEMENRVGRDGFIKVGEEMYTAYPARHGRS